MKKMSTWGIVGLVILGLVVILGFASIGSYNKLVSLKENVDSKYSDIDVQLQRRCDLIPNLVNTVKGFTDHESSVLANISDSRAKLAGASSVSEKAEANQELSNSLSRLLVVVENYPDLKADSQFTALMDNLEGTENRLAVARKDYNAAVESYNKAVRSFPSVIFASMFGFETAQRFEASEQAKTTTPTVDFSK